MSYIIMIVVFFIVQGLLVYLAQQRIIPAEYISFIYVGMFMVFYLVYAAFWGKNFRNNFNNKNNQNSSPFKRLRNLGNSYKESQNQTNQDLKDNTKEFFKNSFGGLGSALGGAFGNATQGQTNLEQKLKSPSEIRNMISPIANRTTIEANLDQIVKIKKVKKSKEIPNSYDLIGEFPDNSTHNFRATLSNDNPPQITSLERIS